MWDHTAALWWKVLCLRRILFALVQGKITGKQGDTYTNTVTDMIVQVLNHGTHHRGQIMTMMKEEGFVLPNIDYITFVR